MYLPVQSYFSLYKIYLNKISLFFFQISWTAIVFLKSFPTISGAALMLSVLCMLPIPIILKKERKKVTQKIFQEKSENCWWMWASLRRIKWHCHIFDNHSSVEGFMSLFMFILYLKSICISFLHLNVAID